MPAPLPRWDDTSASYAWRHRKRLGRNFAEFWREVYRKQQQRKQAWQDELAERYGLNQVVPRGVNSTMPYYEAAGYEGDPVVGPKVRVSKCKVVTGRYRPVNTGSLVRDLMCEQTLLFQSLSNTVTSFYSWLVNGAQPLNCRYTLGAPGGPASGGVWPRTALFPVWIYRLSCCNGNQVDQLGGGYGPAFPKIQYRLQGTQSADGAGWIYSWVPVNPINNSNDSFPTWNGNNVIVKDAGTLSASRIYHDSTIVKLLVTAPTVQPVSLGIDVVQFNDEVMAPPDEYWLAEGGAVSKALDYASPGLVDETAINEHYSDWLFNKVSHPCVSAYKPPHMNRPAPFRILKKHRMTIGPRDTTSGSLQGPQYLHEHVFREHRWHPTDTAHFNQVNEGPDVDPDGTVNQRVYEKFDHVGVFPDPTKQKWLMVHSFGSAPQLNSAAFAVNSEASFDISIRSTFKAVNYAA